MKNSPLLHSLLLLLMLLSFSLFAEDASPAPLETQVVPPQEKKKTKPIAKPAEKPAPAPKQTTLTKEQKIFCDRDMQRVFYKLNELTDGEKNLFLERIKREEAICKGNEKCKCDIFPYMLSEIDKRVALRPAAPVASLPNTYNRDDPPPPYMRSKQAMMAEVEALEYQGHHYKKIGVPLLSVGVAFTLYSLVASTIAFSQYSQCMDDNNSFHDDDCAYHYASSGLGISSMLTFITGVPALITGAIFTAKGNKQLGKAQELKRAAKFTFSASPIIDPQKKLYGATLTLKF